MGNQVRRTHLATFLTAHLNLLYACEVCETFANRARSSCAALRFRRKVKRQIREVFWSRAAIIHSIARMARNTTNSVMQTVRSRGNIVMAIVIKTATVSVLTMCAGSSDNTVSTAACL